MKYLKNMTTSSGASVINDANSMTVGELGPVIMEDNLYIEKIAHCNRERIPERTAFCKGVGAHGYFEVSEPMGNYTQADFLKIKGQNTPVFARFSMMSGEKGSPDTARDVRGLELKFYTEEGNMDLFFSSLPVTPISDMIRYPDFLHARKASPNTGIYDVERFFDFYAGVPEMTNWMIRLYSNQGTRKSYRKMSYFSPLTYIFMNKEKQKVMVRFTLLPLEETEEISWEEAQALAGSDPDVAGKDFYETLYTGRTIGFQLCVQLYEMKGNFCENEDYAYMLDSTQVWNEQEYPLLIIGKMELNRPPQNYFAEVEQSAFSAACLVPGILMSPDRLLQGMAFSTADENRHRLGCNYMQLPINSPKVPVVNYEQDGAMRYYADGGKINYRPSMLARNGLQSDQEYLNSCSNYYCGNTQRAPVKTQDHFLQASQFYQSLCPAKQEALIENFVRDLKNVDPIIMKYVYDYLEIVDQNMVNEIKKRT